MKQYSDCSAVSSAASHFKGCQALDELFHASYCKEVFAYADWLQSDLPAAALPCFSPELHRFGHA